MAAPAAKSSLSLVLIVAGGVCFAAAAFVLFRLGGWEYYTSPLATRGYLPMHPVLRPSGTAGLPLGVAGATMMLCTLPYALRKRVRLLHRLGTLPHWLEAHIFFGIVGPVLVTLHTSFKFNGIISVGYWLMMTVWASGFVGRYLYVRIPKSIRGAELSRSEVEAELAQARSRLAALPLPERARADIEAFQAAVLPGRSRVPGLFDLFFGELRLRLRLASVRRQLREAGVELHALDEAIALASDRAVIVRRLAHLQRTRHLFELWHVFHRPLVAVMVVIVSLHVAIAIYLGYARWGQ
jgi:hypothetical protein